MRRRLNYIFMWGLGVVLGVGSGCTSANPNYLADDMGLGDDARILGDGVTVDGKDRRDTLRSDMKKKDIRSVDGPHPDGPRPDGPRLDLPPRDDILAPDTLAPDTLAPDTLAPDTLAPDTLAPDTLAPDTLAPDTLAPDTLAPDTLAPDTFAPDTGQPECTAAWQCNDWRSCTRDSCVSGHCVHTLESGYCLINGSCRKDGWAASGDLCHECVVSVSTSSLTFVTGKRCGTRGMCVQDTCKYWKEHTDVEPTLGSLDQATSTILESVDVIADTANVWAVGRYASDGPGGTVNGGLIHRIDSSTLPGVPDEVLTSKGLKDVSYRLAVGDAGAAYYYDKGTWKAHTVVQNALAGSDRLGVWGRKGSKQSEVFYLAGRDRATGTRGVVSCVIKGNSASCLNNMGFDAGILLGSIFGVVSGTQQRLWTFRTKSAYDDIYSHGSSGLTWTWLPPAGCLDSGRGSGNQACSNTKGDFRAVHAASLTEAWIVGDGGLVLRYRGVSGWKRVTLPSTISAASYNLTGVYTSATEGLVTIVGYVDSAGPIFSSREVVVVNYNIELDRWFGPISIDSLMVTSSGGSDPGRLRHIGGSGYGNLWMVGDRWESAIIGYSRRVGWVFKLE